MHTSNINIEITLDENKVPQEINWLASDSSADMKQPAKSMMVAFWDGADKSALRIDLWTKDMMVDEHGPSNFKGESTRGGGGGGGGGV